MGTGYVGVDDGLFKDLAVFALGFRHEENFRSAMPGMTSSYFANALGGGNGPL